jgi:membrane protein
MFSPRRFFKLGSTSYKDLAKHVLSDFKDHDCSEHAAAMAYYFLFALFPFLLFLTTLMGVLPIPHLMDYLMQNAQTMLPGEAFNLIKDNIKALFMNKKQGLLSVGFLLALWSSSNAIVSVMDAMNKLYEVKEGRPFWKVRGIAIILVVALSLLILVALTLLMFGTSIGNRLADSLAMGEVFRIGWDVALVPATLFLLILALALVYYFTPDVKQNWRWISPGAVVAIPCWIVMSLGFSFYINNFGSYNKTYGSIGAVIVLLLWLYLSGLVILVGAVINSVIEHSSKEGKEPGEKVPGEKGPEGKESEGEEPPKRAWFFRTFGKKDRKD